MYPDQAVDGEIEVPDPQDPGTVRASRLDWHEHTGGGHLRLLRRYRQLIGLRADVADLHSGDLAATAVEWDRTADADAPTGFRSWVVMSRGDVRVVVNLGEEAATVPVPGAGRLGVLAAWDPVTVDEDAVQVHARSVAVLGVGEQHGAL
jgi:maltooligosyltrehalose trehalohydrolase